MLDILAEISDGPRLVPLLTNLLQYPDPRIRSKVTLLMGRRNQNSRWVEQRKEETDPRVRANAIEGLWGAEDDAARRVLWEASHDPHNVSPATPSSGYTVSAIRARSRESCKWLFTPNRVFVLRQRGSWEIRRIRAS